MKSFLQTHEWAEFQKSVGRKVWRFDDGKIVATVIRHDLPLKKNYLYIPHGPEIDFNAIAGTIGNEVAQFVAYLKNLAREEKSMFVKIEPLDDKVPEAMVRAGFKKSSKEIQPHKTVVLDLEKSEEELLSGMHHKCRYNIKVAERHGLKFVDRQDMDAFWKMLKHTAKADQFSTHERSYYDKLLQNPSLRTKLFFIEKDEVLVVGAIILSEGDTAYYLHVAMDRDPKYKPMMAPYLLHWEIIKWAKTAELKHYDFWGIDAAKWPGVTRFKLGWGGRHVEYPGPFDLPTSKFWFFVYKILRKIF